MTIPIASPSIGTQERERVMEVLDSGYLTDGQVVREFEEAFSGVIGTEHARATANGTAALHAALEAIDLSPDAGVITTPFSFVATANAIRFAGATPVFADIDPKTFNLDPDAAEQVLRDRPESIEALVIVHLYGLPAAIERFRELAETYDLVLVEDVAQAHGATIDGRRVGSFGDVGCFSFYPTKNMTTGEGGMITTDRDDIASVVSSFIDHGRTSDDYEHPTLGHNFRMTNIAAAIGLGQLSRLEEFNEQRRENAARLSSLLADVPVTTPTEPANRRHVFHQYTIRTDHRDSLRQTLDAASIQSAVYYTRCIHHLGCYDGTQAVTPNAERATREVLSLPVHPGVTSAEIDHIADAVQRSMLVR